MKRIGILGGTFNPIHASHIMLAEAAYDQLGLDRVLIMPSKNPPHKIGEDIASDADRANMIRISIEGRKGLEFSDFELRRDGLTYSSDTLALLTAADPDARYYFILGADSLSDFAGWHEPDRILERCVLVCAGRGEAGPETVKKKIGELRDEFTRADFTPEICYVYAPLTEVSSNMIRKLISYDMPADAYLAPGVAEYIHEHGLYVNDLYRSIRDDLKVRLKPSRYEHDISVAKTAVRLAQCHGFDTERPYLAGLLHDCAKYMNDSDMLAAADEAGIELDEVERRAVQLVHAKVGAYLAAERYGVEDPEILDAIRYHTTGRPAMSDLEKLIYLADAIEPLRTWGSDGTLDIIRSAATYDLDGAVYMTLKCTYEHIMASFSENVSDITRQTYEYYDAEVRKSGKILYS